MQSGRSPILANSPTRLAKTNHMKRFQEVPQRITNEGGSTSMTAAKSNRTLMWCQHGPGSDIGKEMGRSFEESFKLYVGH